MLADKTRDSGLLFGPSEKELVAGHWRMFPMVLCEWVGIGSIPCFLYSGFVREQSNERSTNAPYATTL
jgi:hypothetical protein